MEPIFDIAQLDAAAHLKAIGRRIFMRAPIGVPDWEAKQLRLIFFYLLQGRKTTSDQENTRDLESRICRLINVKHCIATGSGREAIKLALISMDAQPGDRVILPDFCCLSVLQPVLELGLKPVLADVSANLQIDSASIKRIIRPGDRAIIVPHLFGGLANISEIVSIARTNGAYVIDDAAQAIGLQGDWSWAGSGGDAGIFSFGLFKPMNAMGGGAFVTNNNKLFDKARYFMNNAICSFPTRSEILKHFTKVYWRKITYRLFLYNRLRQQKRENTPAVLQMEDKNKISKISPFNARLAASQMDDFFVFRQKIQENSRRFGESLSQIPGFSVPGRGLLDGFPRFVIQIDEKFSSMNYRRIFEELFKRGIEMQPTYRPLHRFLKEAGYEPQGEFRQSQLLAEKLFCLSIPQEKELSTTLEALRFSLI